MREIKMVLLQSKQKEKTRIGLYCENEPQLDEGYEWHTSTLCVLTTLSQSSVSIMLVLGPAPPSFSYPNSSSLFFLLFHKA